jgi:gliding motility-associated-like protein
MRNLTRLRLYCNSFVIRLVLIAGLCASVSRVQAQIQGNYTIDNRQPAGNRNFQTFEDCVNFLSGGLTGAVTVTVGAGSGPYNSQFTLGRRLNTSVTKPLIFNCNGVTLTFNSTDGMNRAGIKLDGVDYVTIDGLVIVPTGRTITEYGVGIHMVHDADHNTIRNCTINNGVNTSWVQNNEGIVINGSDDFGSQYGASLCDSNLIIGNKITGGYTGITMSSVPTVPDPAVLMRGNQIIDNQITGFWNAGIYLLYNENTTIQGNEVTNTAHNASDLTGILLHEGNAGTRIIGNRIHQFEVDPADPYLLQGIVCTSVASASNPNIIANNLIYDFKSPGDQYGISVNTGYYLNIYHNTIALENHAYAGTGLTYGIFVNGFSDFNVLNNIITISRTTSGKNVAFYMQSTSNRFTSERNLFYVPSGSTSTNAVGNYSGTQTTLANWKIKTGKDLLSVSSDPQYTDPVTFNLLPKDSAIDNLGQYVGISNDFTGTARNNQQPDIGAYEFLTPICIGPVAGGSTTVLPTPSFCEGSQMSLNLTGNSFGAGQVYQWQTSSTINGTYTNVGAGLANPATTMPAVSTLYYRASVTCRTLIEYSVPIQVTVTPSLAGNTYTINSAQASGGNNFQTFNDALNSIRCGIRGPVVFNVVDNGTFYREQLIIPAINGTSAVNTVTFNGNGATMAFLSTNKQEQAVIKLNGASYFIFNNLKVNPEATTSGQYGAGFQMLNAAHHNTIKNCTITLSITSSSSDLAGIVMSPTASNYRDAGAPSYCDSNLITGNTIIGGLYGITCTSSPAMMSQGNVIINNIIRDVKTYGMWISNSQNALVEGNDISRPNHLATNISGLYGIYTDADNKKLLISKNKIHNPYGAIKTNGGDVYGIFNSGNGSQSDKETVIVSNNLVYNMDGYGIQTGIANSGANYVQYYHNTVSIEDSTGTSTKAVRAFYLSSNPVGLVLKNNNVVIKRGGTGPKYCMYVNDSTTIAATMTATNNNLYNGAKSGTTNYIGYMAGSLSPAQNYTTLADWQKNTQLDANSISFYPNFQDPANVDFTPTVQGMDNKGIPAGITTDIKGVTRHAIPDVGAFEFSVCFAISKPVVKVSDSTTSQVTFTWNAITNATGYLVSTDGTNFTAPSAGTTGTTHIVSNITAGNVSLTVIALGTTVDCPNDTSLKVTGHTLCLQLGTVPVAKIDTATATSIRFSWTAAANATGYKVSINGGNFNTPSSGLTGLYHVVTGLTAGTDVSFTVQAQGSSVNCPTATSNKIDTRTPNSKYFVPNAFTPNGNTQSDVFRIESHEIRTMRLMIFNQWGQKIFETSSQQNAWDGTFNGKQQPVGVYVYALTMTMMDGTVENKKGTISLIR